MKFRAVIESAGKTAAGIHVPDEVVAALGPSRHPAVRATLNGYTYRSSVAVVSGRFMLGVSAEVRAAAGVAAGDELDFDLELDTEPRVADVPAELAAALAADPAASQAFDRLSYSNKRRLVIPIANAKTDATRARNIAKALSALREGRA